LQMHNLALIKLGGSVVTFKDRPLAANHDAIDKISLALKKLDVPAIIVHGGGSFGHYRSVQYDMHTKPAAYDVHGVSLVHESMVALNQVIVNAMIRSGLNPYGIPPSVFTTGNKPILAKMNILYSMAKSKVMPVTYGDVVHMDGPKYSIFSGDSIMTVIARALRPSRVVFATNVDGVYKDPRAGQIMSVIQAHTSSRSIGFVPDSAADVTGGMKRKITEAFKIARSGMDVLMVNGFFPERIIDAAKGKATVSTLIRKVRSRS
jgi:isopentenyl phosphate kinase